LSAGYGKIKGAEHGIIGTYQCLGFRVFRVYLSSANSGMSLQFMVDEGHEMMMLWMRQAESLIRAFHEIEKLYRGGNDPQTIQRMCRIIIPCILSLHCICPDLDHPASTSFTFESRVQVRVCIQSIIFKRDLFKRDFDSCATISFASPYLQTNQDGCTDSAQSGTVQL
jgi:hypothetical protein